MRTGARKTAAFLLCAALLAAFPIIASAKDLNGALFEDGKEALTLISYGEYQKALDKLNFTEPPAESDFEDFVCFELDSVLTQTVQTDVAVCYHKGKKLYLAIPVEEPVSRDVETLVLSSSDGEQFDGYKSASWGDVMKLVKEDDAAQWDQPYDPGTLVVVPDE
jgi:hypothetical protein